MSERYVIISADGHCGLPLADYRPYLESRFHPAFDEWLAFMEAERAKKLDSNFEYIMGWETSNEEGLRGAYDPTVRDRELDQDGVSADVLFADADAVTGMGSPPFGAGLAAGEIDDPDLAFAGARAHNRFLAELCSTSPHRRARDRPRPGLPRPAPRGHRGRVGRRATRYPRGDDPDHVAGPGALQQRGLRAVLGGVCRRAVYRCTPTPVRHRRRSTTATSASTSPRWCGGRHGRRGTCSFSGAFERHPDLKFVVTEAAAYWVADYKWKWDQYMGGGHTTKKMAALLEGKISKLPSEYFGTNLFVGPPPCRRRRSADATCSASTR